MLRSYGVFGWRLNSEFPSFDCYAVLGLHRSASPSAVRSAYLDLAKKHHPDAGGESSKFLKIKTAYEVLSEKRSEYDAKSGASRYGMSSEGFDDRFQSDSLWKASTGVPWWHAWDQRPRQSFATGYRGGFDFYTEGDGFQFASDKRRKNKRGFYYDDGPYEDPDADIRREESEFAARRKGHKGQRGTETQSDGGARYSRAVPESVELTAPVVDKVPREFRDVLDSLSGGFDLLFRKKAAHGADRPTYHKIAASDENAAKTSGLFLSYHPAFKSYVLSRSLAQPSHGRHTRIEDILAYPVERRGFTDVHTFKVTPGSSDTSATVSKQMMWNIRIVGSSHFTKIPMSLEFRRLPRTIGWSIKRLRHELVSFCGLPEADVTSLGSREELVTMFAKRFKGYGDRSHTSKSPRMSREPTLTDSDFSCVSLASRFDHDGIIQRAAHLDESTKSHGNRVENFFHGTLEDVEQWLLRFGDPARVYSVYEKSINERNSRSGSTRHVCSLKWKRGDHWGRVSLKDYVTYCKSRFKPP